MGSDRKARDGDPADAPTAVHAKKRAALKERAAASRIRAQKGRATDGSLAMKVESGSAATATLDQMVQWLRSGLSSDMPGRLQETELVVRSSPCRPVDRTPSEPPFPPSDPPTLRSRYACLPPGPSDFTVDSDDPHFNSEAPTAAMPPIPRAPRIPEVEGIRLFAPTISSNPPDADEPTWNLQRWSRPMRMATVLILAAVGFLLAALLILLH